MEKIIKREIDLRTERIDKGRKIKNSTSISKSHIEPKLKISGSHSTIIGGREGRKLLKRIAELEYIKKIIPGVIENRGTSKGSVRLKFTRCDGNGNIRALLIHGGAVQQFYIITTAGNREEGEVLLEMLRSPV